MNFRVEWDDVFSGHVLGWGHEGRMVIDRFGTILEVHAHGGDRQFRHAAQRHVRKAAAAARMEYQRHQFGTRTSPLRQKFIARVAELANALEAAE